MAQARRRLQKAFKARSKEAADTPADSTEALPEMEQWHEESGGEHSGAEESNESLDWDPVDGMHAERQRPVKDLKRIFDKSKVKKR